MKISVPFLSFIVVSAVSAQTTSLPKVSTTKPTTTAKPPTNLNSILSDTKNVISEVLSIKDQFNATRDVSFMLYTPKNRTMGKKLTATYNSLNSSYFNPLYATRILIHGWENDINSSFNTLVKDAYLKRGNFNVISVDWEQGAEDLDYIVARNRIPSVANEVVKLLKFLVATNSVQLKSLVLAGHSLGAHMCGLVGKQVPGINAIVGMDPADPLFYKSDPQERLANTDALNVQVVHTSALGLQYAIGDADFFADQGILQPGCIRPSCSHSRAYVYFAESIIGPNKFSCAKCSSLMAYILGLCQKNQKFLFGGEPLDLSLSGSYYFEVNKVSPFGQG